MRDDLTIRLNTQKTLRMDMQEPERLSLALTGAVRGTAAVITDTVTQYQTSASGTTIPEGTWLDNVPAVEQGAYLWIRTVITWSNGQSTTLYSVSRFGMDGQGSVNSVNGVSPDANGNVTLPIDSAPAQNSSNPVKSSGIHAALLAKQNTLTFDDSPAQNSSNPVKSSGIYNALAEKQSALSLPLSASNGGTGQSSLQAARNAMGLGNTTGALPVANGGTGATSASAARANLGLNFSLDGTTLTITVT